MLVDIKFYYYDVEDINEIENTNNPYSPFKPVVKSSERLKLRLDKDYNIEFSGGMSNE